MAHSLKKLSKFLSLVLRHHPDAAGVRLDDAGWADVDALLEGMAARGKRITRGELERVVATNDKKRFAFSEDGRRIRASQGHSVPVELGYQPTEPPALLFHGTPEHSLESIRRDGLRKGQRHHVHLSPTPEVAAVVGQRRGRAVVLCVDASTMHCQGHVFYQSANGVWLTDAVPPEYLRFP